MGFVCLRAPKTGVVVGSILLATVSATGAAGERLHMPYDCRFDGSHVQLEPADDRGYDIIGPRESEILTACAPYDANRCRSWKVHRFRFQCGGVQVSWLEAAAAAARMTRRDAWVEDGRLHVRMGPMWVVARGGPFRERRRLREMPGVTAFDPEAFEGHRGDDDVVTAPPGFAPAFGIPMAFTGGDVAFDDAPRTAATAPIDEVARAPVAPVTNRWERTEAPVSIATAAPAVAGPQAHAVSEPEPATIPELPERAPKVRPKPVAAKPAPAPAARASAVPQPASAEPATSPGFTLINGSDAAARTKPPAAPQEPQSAVVPPAEPLADEPVKVAEAAPTGQSSGPVSEPAPAVAGAPGFAPPAAVNEAIETLAATKNADAPAPAPTEVASPTSPSLAPLGRDDGPDVMMATAVAATVFAIAGLAVFGFRRWRGSPEVEVAPPVARDFGAISFDAPAADDAEPEPSEESDDVSIPSNYTQALHVLGASADASTDAIKKIVDGLRKSWHPDHARSETDRMYREKRARQINVAWDIVSQRRAVA
jgi:hypothetical protein